MSAGRHAVGKRKRVADNLVRGDLPCIEGGFRHAVKQNAENTAFQIGMNTVSSGCDVHGEADQAGAQGYRLGQAAAFLRPGEIHLADLELGRVLGPAAGHVERGDDRQPRPVCAVPPPVERTRWIELFRYPRSIIAGCLTGLTQTGGVALALWQVTLFVMVLKITPPEASKLVIYISIAAIAGRFFCSWISDAWGRRTSGIFSCLTAAFFMFMAGYLHSAFIGGVSMFFLMILLQSFFGSGNYSIVGPYMGELWPARLRGSGMGLVYGVGNLGKFIGPAGLALIAGSSNYVKPQATLDALIPGFAYFASWYVLGALAFAFIAMETRGRTIDEIDAELTAPARSGRPKGAAAA